MRNEIFNKDLEITPTDEPTKSLNSVDLLPIVLVVANERKRPG